MPSSSVAARARRFPRWLRWLLVAWAVYVLLAAVFLNTALADKAFNRFPERFSLQWRAALSLYPGQVMAWDVTARGHVRRNQWQAQAGFAHGRIALSPLLWRELRLPAIRARDARFVGARTESDMPPREAREHGWTIHLPRIDSDSLREARWEDWILIGPASARFGLRKTLRGGPMEVLPSWLSGRGAQLRHGERLLFDEVAAQARFALAEHRSAEFPGIAKLDLIDASLDLQAAAPQLLLRPDAEADERVALAAGGGRLRAGLAFRHGEWQPGGAVDLDLPVRSEFGDGTRYDSRLALALAVDDGLHLRATLPAQANNPLHLDADLRIARRRIDPRALRELLPQTSGTLALRWHFDSLHWLSSTLVHGDWLAFDGHGELEAQLHIDRGRLQPGSRFEVPEAVLAVRTLDNRISGSARARGRIEGEAEVPQVRIELIADRFAVAPDAEPDQPYVHGQRLHVELSADGDLERFRDEVKARLRFSDANIPDLTRYNHHLPRRNLRFTAGEGRLSGDLHLDGNGHIDQGRIDLRAREAGLRVADLDLRADVEVSGRLVDTRLDQRRMQLDGTLIELRRVSFADRAGRQRRDWWARIALPSAQARWKRPLALDGEVDITVKDIGFLLALVERRKPLPGWAVRLIDAGQTRISGIAQLRGRHLVLDRLAAHNDRFGLNARLRLEKAQLHGDVLLNWKALALGIELAPEDRDYRFIRPRHWYRSQPDLLPAATP